MVLTETFWVAFVATTSAMVIKLASLCFKSKCKECVMCGGRIRIIRDTESEEKQSEFEMTHPPSPSSKSLGDTDE
jgi:hypothetical protein